MTQINISKYKVMWAEFTPVKGIVTKHDQRVFGATITWKNCTSFKKHFASKEKALEYICNFDKRLDKRYTVRLFTDAQFSKSVNGVVKYTKKQSEETYTV